MTSSHSFFITFGLSNTHIPFATPVTPQIKYLPYFLSIPTHTAKPIASRPYKYTQEFHLQNLTNRSSNLTSIMKISYLTALASCAAVVLSQPLEKRVLVWETVFEEVIQTVDVTTTLYDNAPSVTPKVNLAVNEPAPEPTSAPEVIAPKPSQTSTRTSRHKHRHSHTKKVSVTPLPPVIESVTPVVAPEATSTPAVQVPAPVLPQAQYEYSFDAQTQTPSPSVTPVPAPVYSYSIDPQTKSAAPAPSVTPLPPPPPPPVVQNPPPAPVAKYSPPSASSGGACGTVGGQCVGDITFYETGLGACGWTNDGNSEDVFALAHGMPVIV